jgi:hypothetical protein
VYLCHLTSPSPQQALELGQKGYYIGRKMAKKYNSVNKLDYFAA